MRLRFLDFSESLPHRVVVARRRADQELFLDADISVLPADEPQGPLLGWAVYEEVGIGVINVYAVATITIDSASGESYTASQTLVNHPQPSTPTPKHPLLYPAFRRRRNA